MGIGCKNGKGFALSPFLLCFIVCFFFINHVFAQPVNDSCSRATLIAIPASGYGLGTFTSAPSDFTTATVQAGETYAPAIFVAGLNKKSVWYKFSIPTIRAVRVTLTQPGTTITAGDVGFAVYQANSCLPGNNEISSKLTPIVTFGNTYHPCVPSGEYLIQVSSNANANGPITVQVEISDQTGAAYDHPNQAYAFGTVGYYAHRIDFSTECQSIEDSTEVCSVFANKYEYNKSAWLTFTTPAYFDYLVVQLSGTGVSSYFPSNNNQAIKRKFGYTLYQGNAVNTPINALTTIEGCDSLETDGYYSAYKVYKCSDLQRNTTYSIQLFIKKDFGDDVRLGILTGGQIPTKAPKPILSAVPAPNAIGNLASSPNGTLTTVDDVWGCNSRHQKPDCSGALPDSGILFSNGGRYNLSSFFTFTLTTTSAVTFTSYVTQCGPQPLIRVFKQGLTNNCADLDTSNIIGAFTYAGTIDCLEPGNYTVQISGQDPTDWYGRFNYATTLYNYEQCLSNNLGASFRLDLRAFTRKAANKFSLDIAGAVDSINSIGNVMQPLLPGVTYASKSDTMGCRNTVRLSDTTCSPVNNKVMYREFVVADSGVVDFSNMTWPGSPSAWRYRLYGGDASALAASQNVYAHPDKITGLVAKTDCFDGYTYCTNKRACVLPGTYTFATMGGDNDVGRVDQPGFTFLRTRTKHNSAATAQDLGNIMDTLGPGGGTITTDVDEWSCLDNAVTINGYDPCMVGGKPATKAIYRQFYLKEPALIRIENTYYYFCADRAYGTKTLFYGKATNGLAGLTPVGNAWSCFQSAGATVGCELLPAGWYTVVSYNQGPSYDSTTRNLNMEGRYNSAVSYSDEYKIIVTAVCNAPKFNRPHKAAVDGGNQPFLITWGDRPDGTPAYPKRDSAYKLPAEYFNCLVDTPFANHPIKPCQPNLNRVAYYVFKTTQVGFVQINTYGYYAMVYDKDVRSDSAQFTTLNPIQTCNNTTGYIQFCFFQPGTYTLVIFAGDANVCQSVAPSIYMDETGYSRFDFANKAYDFGVIPPDSLYHYGKVGDVNPLNSGRAPSNDFIYCTTGAFSTDPANSVCYTTVNPNVYNSGPNKPLFDSSFLPSNGVTRRNLWYTFVIDQPGYVKVRVEAKLPRRLWESRFSVYKSDVDGTLPFSTVVSSGQVDSTVAQGLTHVASSLQTWYYCANNAHDLSFYRDPCNSVSTRYYLLVESPNGEPYESGGALPNMQIEVSIIIDSVTLVLPKHDHYSQAGDIGTVGVGTFTGDVDNYSCATKDPTDPIYYYNNSANCIKTLWYKFTPTITGNVRYRAYINGVRKQDYYDIQLFRQIVPGDSTTNGLQIIGYTGVYGPDNTYWAQTCVSPGTYYLLLTGCDQVGAYVYPEIQLLEQEGDFCSRAVPAVLNGPGSVTATVLVNCHTIGTDYGEFGPQLTCPQGGTTADYKSSWFRMDIGGTDTLDLTTFLIENTNASSSDIKYRMMTGDCGAMQEQSCVLDALTQNTYQCLVPGQSYYIQVFTPVTKFGQPVTGTIDLKISAILHADTCAPKNNCLANSNFISQFDCATDTTVRFVNFSTFGSSIQYKWDFGFAGQTSAGVSPNFDYPALPTAQTYNVSLKVQNTACNKSDSVTIPITIPGRPKVNLGPDTSLCKTNDTLVLSAATWAGSTYLWNTGDTTPTKKVSAAGAQQYIVKVTYNGCIKKDTIWVYKNPITSKTESKTICNSDSVQLTSNRNQGETYLWNTSATTSSIYASTPGTYINTMKWHGCTIRDTFNVSRPFLPLGGDTSVCLKQPFIINATSAGALSYLWQNGTGGATFNATTPGLYWVQVNYSNCNIRDTINVTTLDAVAQAKDTTICSGQGYMLSTGVIKTTAGTYLDSLKSKQGCDSIITTLTLSVRTLTSTNTIAAICAGETYTLPSGAIVNQPGTYNDTIRYNTGCDSLIANVVLTLGTVRLTNNPIICQGMNYTLPSGFTVSATGTYVDTVKHPGICDSIITTNLLVKTVTDRTLSPVICAGQTYTLPAGQVVSQTATYYDTLRYGNGCDSMRSTVNLLVRPLINSTINPFICQGQNYTLPSGIVITTAGTYFDTIRYNTGCDSLRSIINLGIKQLTLLSSAASICAGQNYTLPSGKIVNASGIYNDTLRYNGGCDSVINTVDLNVKPVTRTSALPTICQGQNYTLPSGKLISTAGIYSDSIKYNSGCDSLITTVTLSVKNVTRTSAAAAICSGQTYTLPSGKIVNTAATYIDTIKYIAGCDSLISTIIVSVKVLFRNSNAATICQGQSYTLPSGKVVNAMGLYNDTVRYMGGCDSLISTTNLTVNLVTRQTITPSICAGQTYTLPSGKLVNAQGTYPDTLRYRNGCDSVINTIMLTVKPVTRSAGNASICSGQSYILPSGKTVNTAGTFIDTIKYTTGCDSLISTITLTIRTTQQNNAAGIICQGQVYTLPSGATVTAAGIYKDTLRYSTGCDSVITTVNVSVKQVTKANVSATVCQGQTFILPSGKVVNATGIYSDTIRYGTGCDSLITTVNLFVFSPINNTINPSICTGEVFILPSGIPVSTAGNYVVVIKNQQGCDSIINTIRLTVNAMPVVQLTKSNDINCIMGTATLTATGGSKYAWSPAIGLNNAYSYNPIASPATTTTYKASVTSSNGCTTTDSIQVKVNKGDSDGGYLLPSAFTPNGDGNNDCFGVKAWGAVTGLQFRIFDRWGTLVFTSNDASTCWDGTYNGVAKGTGAYVYSISANTVCGPVVRKGTIVLIR